MGGRGNWKVVIRKPDKTERAHESELKNIFMIFSSKNFYPIVKVNFGSIEQRD